MLKADEKSPAVFEQIAAISSTKPGEEPAETPDIFACGRGALYSIDITSNFSFQ
jgi:hypothetical protein